MDKLSKKIWYF